MISSLRLVSATPSRDHQVRRSNPHVSTVPWKTVCASATRTTTATVATCTARGRKSVTSTAFAPSGCVCVVGE